MQEKCPRISSAEVADFMLRLNRPVSAPELTVLLQKAYPGLLVEKNDIYIRLKGFYRSAQADCVLDDDVRPRTFHLKAISSHYFKFRNGRRIDLSTTVIKETLLGEEKEKATLRAMAFGRELFHRILAKRSLLATL
ncbi:hypothetical protein KGP26_29780 (plasmid) [Serratia sp. JSRIV002]|uniref:Uncharacterized protein n=1 Tax=Serratia silvae TaxID=2824122 RepID=A0ABT0KHW1_9GAMM|nr:MULTISPECIES: hypothetical protein [Serratia]MCL1031324.1 hypothetical protein [Serratia silvae]UAN54739.1 hypothetical protein KGP26_29780 [Serratia sp. JSRIV002]